MMLEKGSRRVTLTKTHYIPSHKTATSNFSESLILNSVLVNKSKLESTSPAPRLRRKVRAPRSHRRLKPTHPDRPRGGALVPRAALPPPSSVLTQLLAVPCWAQNLFDGRRI